MLAKSLLVLAMQAGHTLVDVAAGDEWETAQRGYAQMLGRGNAQQTRLAEQRLRTTRKQLIGAAGSDVGLIRKALAIGWANWLADLLEEHPDAEADLQALVQEIPSVPPAGTPSALHTETPSALRTATAPALRAGTPPARRPALRPATRSPPTAMRSSTQPRRPSPSTPAPWPSGASSPTRSGKPGTRPPRGTSSPRCYR